jgi:vancomycin permeability regulator SanA
MVCLLAVATVWNIIEFYFLLANGRLRPLLPVPMSLFVLAALGLVLRANLRPTSPTLPAKLSPGVFAIFAACVLSFPIFQMMCFGRTDYRRPADVAVVFGARAFADGRPSVTLADRVRTACQLYRDGLTRKLIFSGGPGDGAIFETESMRRMAIGLGVRAEDILTDPAGLNTQATVQNTEALFTKLGAKRILVVSHFYHLPRIKMAYQRAGWDVYTVPARESSLRQLAPLKSMGREVAAMWVYYFRPLV